ncbi:winged helix-turn-helix domain-containing protein [Cellulomonas sp. IC4_254]|uniref:winged helix-turn-helix domain-containing protein n=1 Tax=Cellulomonas sp. IC4_254 TaxID=2714040 RepID=UPI0014201F78|nr:winged helix-turn-helix domain-containing protein [Cellulomonas sp. IC4_254]NHT16866.1 winged helix-turn-helix transcriptional regulator [Cellulomonas sp. IC4_254]
MTALAWEVLTADDPQSVAELASKTGANHATVSRTLDDLEADQLVTTVRQGRARLAVANNSSPAVPLVRDLIEMSMEPPAVLAHEFRAVGGIKELRIFGSWAARVSGVKGPAPRDIDLLVRTAGADPLQVAEAAKRATQRLGIEVHPTLIDAAAPSPGGQAFLSAISTKPSVRVRHTPLPAPSQSRPDFAAMDQFLESMRRQSA